MPKRISRKLLVGLGSIVTFGAVGTVSGFGIKSIIDSSLNNSKLNQLNFNTSETGSLNDIPNYNVATEDMFIKTKNLKRFHFGNTQIGQKITPWGWLGVFDDSNGIKSRIALTAWNGEIIWVNDDYTGLDDLNVYDMQYDFNSNLLFVLRTNSSNGFYNTNNQYPKVWLEVLDARTGEKYADSVEDTEFQTFQEQAKNKLIDVTTLLYGYESDANLRAKTKNLYYLDLTYSSQRKAILATWMPNYMQMARQKYNPDQEGSLPSFWDVINTWDEVATSFVFDTTKLENNEKYKKKERKFDLLKSAGINPITTSQGETTDAYIEESQFENPTTVKASEIFLLTNPFFTTSHDGKAFVMHLIGATFQGKVYHKTIGWTIETGDSPTTSGVIYSLTEGNNGLIDKRRYDNIEYWTGGGGYFELQSNKSWTKAKGWHKNFINANLRVNKNMFDENSIVFAYPYSSSSQFASQGKAMPVFNVAQIWIDKNNAQLRKTKATTQKDNFNFNFGKQINDYYDANHAQYDNNMRLNNIQPYPQPSSVENNFNHSYNRLISVSPFDNTIIYAAKPNLRMSIFDSSDQNKDKWAGFWVANSWAWRWNKGYRYYHPLIIGNDPSIPLASDRYNADEMNYMLSNINDLYTEGFTFDIRSMIDANWRTSLNLYFNQTGKGVNERYNNIEGFQSSKIGLLKDVLYQTRSNDPNHSDSVAWVNNVTGLYAWAYDDTAKKFLSTTINKDSFSSIIHSRADLKKWYPRTWANANFPSNMLRAQEIFSIDNPSSYAVATKFNSQLSGTEFNGKESIDLVTAWKDKGENNAKYNNRFNRLIMRRPKIETGLTSEENDLGLVTKYELLPDIYTAVTRKEGWELSTNTGNLTLTKVETAQNTSKQILSAWGDSYKMKKIGSTTSQLDQTNTAWNQEIKVTDVLDKKDHFNNPNTITFGSGNNNNITRNNTQALRLMLRIVKPTGNLPAWFNNLSSDFFDRAYPLESAYPGETTFKEVVKAFADQKAQLIDLSQSNGVAVGLGNLKIDAYLELNPKFAKYNSENDKVIEITSGRLSGAKILTDKDPNNNNQLIIYKDERLTRTIYDQSEIDYTSFNQGGFNSTTASWSTPNELNNLKNIKVTTDYSQLTDTLVRKQANKDPLLTFDFKQGTTDQLELEPTDRAWFENHFKNYNRLLGLFVKFEYQKGTDTTNWIELTHNGKAGNNIWTDQEISQNLTDNNNKLLLSNVPQDIKKLRFRLVENPNPNDDNTTIDIQNFDGNNNKYISDPLKISVQRIVVNKDWITQVTLSTATGSIVNITESDIRTFETNVLSKITNQTERQEVQLLYSFEGSEFNLTANQLAQKIIGKFNKFTDPDQGVFALWNGTNGEQLIKAKFVLKNAGGDFKLVTANNTNPDPNDLLNDVKSDIKSKIDMSAYINELQSTSIKAVMGNNPGEIKSGSIQIPGKLGAAGQDRFNSKTFDDINTILKTQGVSIKFKKQDAAGGNWSGWLELDQIITYATSKPAIQIGFVPDTNKPSNLELVNGGTTITEQIAYELKLNLPKVVKLPANETEIKNAYSTNPFTGNTKNLDIDKAKLKTAEQTVLSELKKASGNPNDYSGLDAILEFKYQVGNSGFLKADELKTTLSSKQEDLNSNALKMKVEIKTTAGQNPEFALEQSLADKEFELLSDNNKTIKKWLHGKDFENELKTGQITVTGSKQDLQYNLGPQLTKFDKSSGKYESQQLRLQYQLLDASNQPINSANNNGWVEGYLPDRVENNVNKIKVRVGYDKSISEVDKIYVYGPEVEKKQAEATLDLSQIATLIKINPVLFEDELIVNTKTDTKSLTAAKIKEWENKIYKKIPEITAEPNLKNKLIIKYQFIIHEGLTSDNLLHAINEIELKKYDSNQHHGIVRLYDKTIGQQSGYQIKATFEKQDPNDKTIKFVDNTGAPIDDDLNKEKRTFVANTTNITTTIDLSKWINHLMTNLTVVATGEAGKIPAGGLKPPSLSGVASSNLFASQTFENIEAWLNKAQINFLWKKDETGNDWKTGTNNIKEYDATKKKLWFALDNKSSNLKLILGNGFPELNWTKNDNKTQPITIQLDAPAIINVQPNQLGTFGKYFSGNTKYLNVEVNKLKEELDKIKQKLGAGFENAPLTIMIQVGYQQFYDYKEVAAELEKLPDDVENGIVVAKFAIDPKASNKDKFQITPGGEDEQKIIDDNGTIKVYINDKGIYNDLKATTASGSSKQLKLEWQKGISIDPTSGILTATNPVRGKGLKIEYTFNKALTGGNTEPTGNANEINSKWVPTQPKTFTPGVDEKLFIRIRLVDSNKYTYQNINQKIEIDLTKIKSIITLNPDWLNQVLSKSEIDLQNFDSAQISAYETSVFDVMTNINDNLKDKIEIRYDFNGQNNIDKTKLIQLIKSYKADNPTKDNLGILQLWNQSSGEKIVAKFAIKEAHKDLYELEFTTGQGSNQKELDGSNIFTTIDFSKVIKWLTETKKLVKVEGDSPNAIFKIPPVSASTDDTFNTKEWSVVESTLKIFGISVQYREILNNNQPAETDWKNNLSEVKQYDQNIGKIGIRFKFYKKKSKNIKLKTQTTPDKIFNGKTTDATDPFELSLDIKLNFKIDQSIVDSKFIQKDNVISGNTKFLRISETDEKAMITELTNANAANNQEFNRAGLVVKYKLDKQADWRSREEFINYLKGINTDQQTNKILFKFEVTNTDDFTVEAKEQTLFDPAKSSPDQWKVKIFINNGTWESDAKKVSVTGTTSGLTWNWNGLTVSDQADGKVGNNDKLQVEFSAKENASYDDGPATDSASDLTTGWTTIKPTRIEATTKKLWIRLKAKAGYVYGPAYTDNGQTKTATAHQVDLKIKREIVVKPIDLSTSLTLAKPDGFVSDITKADLDKFVDEGVGKIQPPELQTHVTVKFNFNGSNGLNSDQLLAKINEIIKNNNDPNYGILQLWNGKVGTKIHAYYDLVDPAGEYILVTANNTDAKAPQEVVTGHIRTKINLIAIVDDLKTKKIQVESVTSKNNRTLVTIKNWIMPDTKSGSDALNSLAWDVFEKRLQNIGVSIKARVVTNPDTPKPTDWKSLRDLKEYDDTTLKLALRFELDNQKADNIVLSVLADGDVDPDKNNGLYSSEFQMNIKAPAKVVVDSTFITDFKSKDSFTGDTKFLEINEDPEKELINKIVEKNLAANADIFKDLRNRLEVQYYLGKTNPDSIGNAEWRSAQELKIFLESQNSDQETNQIWFRLNIKETTDADAQVFQIDNSAQVLTQEKIDAQAKIKIYINETGFTKGIESLRAVGSTDDFSITGLDDWKQTLPKKGLEVGYSNQTDPQEHEDTKWTPQPPTALNTDKKLWVRFKVQDGYKFQGAKTDNQSYGPRQAINTDGIRVIIKLQKSWLEKIKITGNTKEAEITDTEVLQAIKDNNVLPSGQDDLVELQYKIQGTNDEWLTKDPFTKKLLDLAGSRDDKNFILRRQELLVRFNINPKNNGGDYGLNIDGKNIDNDNRDTYNVEIVDDASNRNSDFEGYINLDKLKDFIKDNFHIVGSTSQPKLIINNRDQMNTMFAPYASETLFDIQFSTVQNADNSWDWTNTTQSILNAGKLIDEDGLINQGVTIGADKKFAIKFISKDQKYKVYKEGKKEDNGYILDLSDNVKITIEITNPFTAAGKTLGIWTRDGNNGKYFQGEGGFKIVVANKNSLDVENNGTQSAQDFLDKATSIKPNEKEALELVFHYFGQSPSDSEIQRVKAAINNYNDSTIWRSFDEIKDKNNGDWSTGQGYRVGDYVAVALRVKKAAATQENPFILKGDDYSMILPVMKDSNQIEKKPGRIAGYKIKTSDINLDRESITLLSMVNPDLPPLDGWTLLSRLSLKPDDKGNYLGVDLDIQFYNEFYKNTSDEILISGSGAKLVKRVTSGTNIEEVGNYKNDAGKPITDKDGKEVKIYKNKLTDRLSDPEKKSSTPTKTKRLDNLGQGSFRLFVSPNDKKEQGLLSLFKNQDVDLKLVASKGESTNANLPDFYLDNNDKTIPLKEIINPKIKYPIENEDKISYGWNYDNFLAGNIEYKDPKNPNNKRPEEGFAQIATIFKLIKKQGNLTSNEITGDTIDEAVQKIDKQIKEDFKGQLKFEIERYDSKGSVTPYEGNNIYQFQDLKNKDRIVLKIVAVADDLYYVNTERPLIINVDGLTQASPDQSTLQHLRVKQGGVIDGQGSFKVLVSNPDNSNEDDRQILKGWKFMIRVWDTKKEVKINWTDDPGLVKGLTNGDRVEWKLVSEEGNPVKEAYYNSIALQHEQKPDGKIEYKFAQVNYPAGDGTYNVVKNGVGDYPDDETKYPETSGFVISGLKSAVDIFQISKENFAKVMQQLNPTYVGINKQGTIKMEPKYFEDKYWVNSEGELFTKDQLATLKAQDQEETKKEIPLTEFLDNVTFYTHDPVLANYQGGFKFSGNDVNNNNHLTNGDKVWATFDMLNESDENIIINGNEIISSVTLQLSDVSGLKEVIDPMSPLWYVLMALAGVFTLGTAALIAFLMTRHKKLKGK